MFSINSMVNNLMAEVRVCGLDLAGKEKNPSGIAFVVNGVLKEYMLLHSNEEIVSKIIEKRVSVVAVDAPLSHAEGFRKVDLKMIKKGFKLLPPGWKSMKLLVERAVKIKNLLEKEKITVIETHPLSAYKNTGVGDLRSALKHFINLRGVDVEKLPKDIIDAIICAAVAWAYVIGEVEVVSDVDGKIFLLKKIR